MRRATEGNRQNLVSAFNLLVGVSLFGTVSPDVQAAIQFHTFQTHTHIRLDADAGISHRVEKIEKSGNLIGIRFIVRGADDSLNSLAASNDARTNKIVTQVGRDADGPITTYEIYFSPAAIAKGIDYFDYRGKSSPEISLDYWTRAAEVASVHPDQKKTKKLVVPKRSLASPKTSKQVVKLGSSGPTEATINCGRPISPKTDLFTYWKIYHKPFSYRQHFKLFPAESGYKFSYSDAKKGDDFGDRSKEVAHFRLALKLYRETKYALTLRTIDFFNSQYRDSELNKELEFLRAGTFIQLSKQLRAPRYFDQAIELYRKIIFSEPENERARLALAFIVQELMEDGKPMFALEYALIGVEQKGDPNQSIYRLAVAEALFAMGEYDRAERSYQALIDQNDKFSKEAIFRIGEVFAARKFWDRSIISFEKAVRAYPKDATDFPTTWFNLAEAYFRLERYSEAERVYSEFWSRYPNDSAAWAAELRLAEIAQINLKTIDSSKHVAIQKQYENVVNHHPYSPGSYFAELRLSRCYSGLKEGDRFRGFFSDFFAKSENIKIDSPLIEPIEAGFWADLAQSRFYSANGEYREALKLADKYSSRLDSVPLGKEFHAAFVHASLKLVQQLASAGKYRELLAAVDHYGSFVSKPEPLSYLLAVTRAKQKVGDLEGVSQSLKSIETRLSDANDSEKDWFRLTKANQMKILGDKPDAVMAQLNLIRDDSEYADEKFEALSGCAFEKQDYRSAVAYDSRLLDATLAKRLTPARRFEVEVRRLEATARLRDAVATSKLADTVLLKYGTQTEQPLLISRVRDLQAQAFYDANNYKAAADAIREILTQQVDHPRRTEFEFMRGKSLAKLGNDNEALEIFRNLAGRKIAGVESNDVWEKSAQAEIDQLQWESSVSNQIKDKDRRSSQ